MIVMCTLTECNKFECSSSVLPFSVLAEDVEEDSSGDESCMNEPDISATFALLILCFFYFKIYIIIIGHDVL